LQGTMFIGDVSNSKGDGNTVKTVIREGKIKGIASQEANPVSKASLRNFDHTPIHHGLNKIEACHVNRGMLAGRFNGKIRRSSSHIQESIGTEKPQLSYRKLAPGNIPPKAQKMI